MASDPADLDNFEFNEQELLKSSNVGDNDDYDDDMDKNSDNGDDYDSDGGASEGSEELEPEDNGDDDNEPKLKSKKKKTGDSDDEKIDEKDIFRDKKPSKKKATEKKKRSRESDKTSSKNRKKAKSSVLRFFDEEADATEDEEEDDEDQREIGDVALRHEEKAAIEHVERRHEKNRAFLSRSADEIAAEYERQHELQEKIEERYEAEGGLALPLSAPVAQQALLPSVKDPKLFKIKCRPGTELIAIRSIMLKTMDLASKSGILKVKSAFYASTKQYIYVEAISEPFAKEILNGLKMLFHSSFVQVPINNMTSVLSVTMKKSPLKVGQFVRVKRGLYKGDLARIVQLREGSTSAFLQIVPRLSYTESNSKKASLIGNGNKARPAQGLFDAEQAKAAGGSNNGYVFRRHHPLDSNGPLFDVWNGDYYRDGFLYKEVSVATYVDDENVKPKIEELEFFVLKKKNKDDDLYDDHHGSRPDDDDAPLTSFNDELTKQIRVLQEEQNTDNNNTTDQVHPFVPGDLVQVVGGEMNSLVGRVISLNDVNKTVKLSPINNIITHEIDVEVQLLVKYVYPGAHVKVMGGKYNGQTGRVVSVSNTAQEAIAFIITDGTNNEIQCNVSLLQLSSEVATGHGNLMGYELYDLVALNDNESAVITNVGMETLRVINNLGNVKELSPQEIRNKINHLSAKTKSFDVNQNTFSVGDTLHVISGPHAKLTGTVKHINKGTIWLHSTTYLKNSGIFVAKNRSCAVSGSSASSNSSSQMAPPSQQRNATTTTNQQNFSKTSTPSSVLSRTPGGMGGIGGGRSLIGTTVRISTGTHKGMLAQIVDVTATHYSVELLAKLKKIVVPISGVVAVGDKKGSFEKATTQTAPDQFIAPATPFLSAQTPMHMLGSETPRYGSETPLYSAMTPSYNPGNYHDDDDNGMDTTNTNTFTTMTSTFTESNRSIAIPTDNHTSTASANTTSNTGSATTWVNGMVVAIKTGNSAGKLAVVQEPPDYAGNIKVRLRDGMGRIGTELTFGINDLNLAEPSKKEQVLVLSGNHAGKMGIVKMTQGKDVMVEIPGEKGLQVLKMSAVAWMNQVK